MNITMVQNSIQYSNMCKDVSENSNMNNFFQQFNAMMQQNSNFDMQNVVMKASSDWIEQMKKIQEGWKNSNSKPE